MTPATTISRELAEATFLAIRMALGLALITVLAVCVRRAILTFAGEGYRNLGRRKWWLAGATLLAMALLELIGRVGDHLRDRGRVVWSGGRRNAGADGGIYNQGSG